MYNVFDIQVGVSVNIFVRHGKTASSRNMKIKGFYLCLRRTDRDQERDVRNALRDLENLDNEEQ